MQRFLTAACGLALLAAPLGAHDVIHADHAGHAHGGACGHAALDHGGHVDYLHDGHLHTSHDGHVDEHALEVTAANPADEQLVTRVTSDAHAHGHAGEEHAMVQHGAHMDYVHDGRLHHRHGDHTDDHGAVKLLAAR
ncbi:MAG: hypothetical protein MUF47_01855 [Porphyrobacter sp.]|nr:hypothetical protein [Porphyrobacter sp.]